MPQPILPAEVAFTDIELSFIEESPPGLWPENQNSNFGVFRKAICDILTEIAEDEDMLFSERFIDTVTNFLDEWERMLDLPVAPYGKALQDRKADALARLQRGPFTRTGRKNIVERYILAATTGGAPVLLTSAGVAMDALGVPLYGDTGVLTSLYQIVEDIDAFHYTVRIKNTVTPNIPGLTRELTRYTPAGISFDIDNTWNGTQKYGGVKRTFRLGGTHS